MAVWEYLARTEGRGAGQKGNYVSVVKGSASAGVVTEFASLARSKQFKPLQAYLQDFGPEALRQAKAKHPPHKGGQMFSLGSSWNIWVGGGRGGDGGRRLCEGWGGLWGGGRHTHTNGQTNGPTQGKCQKARRVTGQSQIENEVEGGSGGRGATAAESSRGN